MRKLILKLIPIIMLVSLTSIGFAIWVITPPAISSESNGNVVVDDVIELEVLSGSCDIVGLRYNRKGFFTQYTYSEDLNGFETITYDNFDYYVSVDLPKIKESTSIEKAELKIELSSKYINLANIKDLIQITSTTGHVISKPVIENGIICIYVIFDITENVVSENVGINFNFCKVDTKPLEGEEELEEAFFITLSNLSKEEAPFNVLASIYNKNEEKEVK